MQDNIKCHGIADGSPDGHSLCLKLKPIILFGLMMTFRKEF